MLVLIQTMMAMFIFQVPLYFKINTSLNTSFKNKIQDMATINTMAILYSIFIAVAVSFPLVKIFSMSFKTSVSIILTS